MLEGGGGLRDSGRASRYDTFRFTRGYLAARACRNSRASRPARGRRIEHPSAVAMNNFEQHELGFPGSRRANLRLRRGIYLLPSLLTVANMVCGFYAVMSTLKGELSDLDTAAKAIGFAIVFDSFDGFVARATGTSSEFGKQFDSLADMVSFGIAPAVLAFTWGVRSIAETDFLDIRRLHGIGWWLALIFVICCAWRLARFNIQGMAPGSGSKYFVGLPCPAAAGLIAATVHKIKSPIEDWRWSVVWMVIVVVDSAVMSSTVRYRSFKDIPMAARQRSFLVIIMAVLAGWLIVVNSEVVLMVIATVFVASGLTLHVVRAVR